MRSPLRFLPLVSLLLLAAEGFGAEQRAWTEEALPPLFVPRAERRPAQPRRAIPTVVRAPGEGVSDLMRARLREKIAALPVATTSASGANGSVDAVLMDKIIVEAARLPKWTPRRDEPALWHTLKTGVLYEKVNPNGTSMQAWFNILPFTTSGIQPQQSTRFGVGFTFKW